MELISSQLEIETGRLIDYETIFNHDRSLDKEDLRAPLQQLGMTKTFVVERIL